MSEPLNESSSEKEGKSPADASPATPAAPLNESPSEKEGKFRVQFRITVVFPRLNESPYEKVGKFAALRLPNTNIAGKPR